MLQVLGLGIAVTNRDKRYIKKLNGIPIPPEVFSVAAEAVKAITDASRPCFDDRISSVVQAFKLLGIDPCSKEHPMDAIMFRVDALGYVFHQMSEQEFASLNDGDEAMYKRVIAAAVSEPLIQVVQDGMRYLTFDLGSFRKALKREGGLAT